MSFVSESCQHPCGDMAPKFRRGLDCREGAGTVIGSHLLMPVPAEDLGEDKKKSYGETWGQRADVTGLPRIKASWGQRKMRRPGRQKEHWRKPGDPGARPAASQVME